MARCLVFLANCLAAYALLSQCARSTAHADPITRPCAPDDPDLISAEQELLQIDSAVAALDIAADPKPLAARIKALARTRCLSIADGVVLAPTSGLSLKTYWAEGGSEHLRSYLNLSKPGEHWLWLEPTVRRALTLETNPTSPIRELLCRFDDASCGVETRGWAIRAKHEFSTAPVHEWRGTANTITKDGAPVDCEQVALRAVRKARFARFRDCEESRRTAHAALPIGHTRGLDHGWLIVEGRRGHHSFCDETRAYDLATGSAYRVASCSELVPENGGNADSRAIAARRKTAPLEMGHLPLLALREAAWMLLLVDEIDRRVLGGHVVNLPSALQPMVDEGSDSSGFARSMGHISSGDTTLRWRVETNQKLMKEGTLTWSPTPLEDAAAEHAVTLLRIAEASLVENCPEVPPPAAVRSWPALSASVLDGESLDAAKKASAEDWRKLVERQRSCAQVSGAPRASSPASASRR